MSEDIPTRVTSCASATTPTAQFTIQPHRRTAGSETSSSVLQTILQFWLTLIPGRLAALVVAIVTIIVAVRIKAAGERLNKRHIQTLAALTHSAAGPCSQAFEAGPRRRNSRSGASR